MPAIRIVAPEIRAGDAVGNHCLYLAREFARRGHTVTVHAQRHYGDIGEVQDYAALFNTHQAGDTLLLSFSTFQPALARLLALPGHKVVYFHGITPVELLLEHDPAAAYWSSKALCQLPRLAGADHIVANSRWNLDDLIRHFSAPPLPERTSVIPPVTPDMPLFRRAPRVNHPLRPPLHLLAVGRLAPHKRVEDSIAIVAKLIASDVPARLTLIGGATSDDYLQHLHQTARALDVQTHIEFRGYVDDAALDRCYADADLLLSASLHEGFCIPVLEAMHAGLPVVLRRGTAASEVAQEAGLVFDTVDEAAAHITWLLARDEDRVRRVDLGHARARALIEASDAGHLLDRTIMA